MNEPMDTRKEIFGETIYGYSRADAIEDGVLVDVTKTAKEAGIRYPVALTQAVWAAYVEFDPATFGQSIDGRLWDVLWMFRSNAKRSEGNTTTFQLYVAMPDRGDWAANEEVPDADSELSRRTHRLVTLKAVIGPGDDVSETNPDPVITIMLPHED